MASDEKTIITEKVLEVKGRGLTHVMALLKTWKIPPIKTARNLRGV
jgi:hypothetical protein